MTESFEVTISKVIPASAKAVFEAWLDPKALARFIKPMDGMPDCRVDVDAREGGKFLIVMKVGEKELPHRGEYKTIQRYEKLVFTWVSEHSIPDSTVTLTFQAHGPSETKLTLHHIGFPNENSRNSHEGGWGTIVNLLSRFVG